MKSRLNVQSHAMNSSAEADGGISGCRRGWRLGLTGGMGCGKSTVGEMLEKKGLLRLDADQIVRELLTNDAQVREEIVARWGTEICAASGAVDRARLAERVFTDANELQHLENILHPRVAAVRKQRVESNPEADWVEEIPLLFEKNLETGFDFVIAVYVSEEERVQRLLHKGFSVETIQRRSQRQWSVDRKAELADFVLLNQGNLSFLEDQVSLIWKRLGGFRHPHHV